MVAADNRSEDEVSMVEFVIRDPRAAPGEAPLPPRGIVFVCDVAVAVVCNSRVAFDDAESWGWTAALGNEVTEAAAAAAEEAAAASAEAAAAEDPEAAAAEEEEEASAASGAGDGSAAEGASPGGVHYSRPVGPLPADDDTVGDGTGPHRIVTATPAGEPRLAVGDGGAGPLAGVDGVSRVTRRPGNVAAGSEFTLEFGPRPHPIPDDVTSVPFQMQVWFTRPGDGRRMLRVITSRCPVTRDLQAAISPSNVVAPAVAAFARARTAQLAAAGECRQCRAASHAYGCFLAQTAVASAPDGGAPPPGAGTKEAGGAAASATTGKGPADRRVRRLKAGSLSWATSSSAPQRHP